MATPRQILIELGFKQLCRKLQTSNKYTYWGIVTDGVVVAKAGIEAHYWSRTPSSLIVFVGDKRRITDCDWKTHKYSDKQLEAFRSNLQMSIAAGTPPAKPKAPRPPSPMKGATMSDDEKRERAVWRHLGELTCCGYIDKEMQKRLYYVKAGKHIRVEDEDSVMAYTHIHDSDLEPIGMTVAQLEAFLVSKGVKRQRQKRVKYAAPLYD